MSRTRNYNNYNSGDENIDRAKAVGALRSTIGTEPAFEASGRSKKLKSGFEPKSLNQEERRRGAKDYQVNLVVHPFEERQMSKGRRRFKDR